MNKVKFCAEDIQSCSDVTEFYTNIGLSEFFNKEITNVSQMKINPNTFNDIQNILLRNCKKKFMSQTLAERSVYFNWANYSPVNDDNIEEWCIEWREI